MGQRKTFSVAELKKRANHFLLHSEDGWREQRKAWASMVEGVLMDTGNYRGFGYLNADNMRQSESGCSVGVRYSEATDPQQRYNEHFVNTDDTRRFYF